MFTVENVFRERSHFLSGHAVPFKHISFCAGNNPRAATVITRKRPKFNVFLFLLNALCVGEIVHSDPILKEVVSYYMSLNKYGAPSRFHTTVRGVLGFLGLEIFHGNGLTEAALSLDRPSSSPDLTPLVFFWCVYKGCSIP